MLREKKGRLCLLAAATVRESLSSTAICMYIVVVQRTCKEKPGGVRMHNFQSTNNNSLLKLNYSIYITPLIESCGEKVSVSSIRTIDVCTELFRLPLLLTTWLYCR